MSNPELRAYSYSEILLALTVWREARGESGDAMAGVAWTVRNRVAHPKWWGHDLVEVMTHKWQYSSIAAPNDPQLIKYPLLTDVMFPFCLEIASGVLDDYIADPTDGATSYYDISIKPPAWATPDKFTIQIGRLIFYRIDV